MAFHISIPWIIRPNTAGEQGHQKSMWWNRKKHRNDSDAAKHPQFLQEDDLDHLGALHRSINK